MVKQFKFLGLIFDSKLSWNLHIQYVIKKCLKLKSLFYVITRSRSGPDLPALLTLYKALVRSCIDYGLIVYGSASKSLLSELDKVQNVFMRRMLGSLPSTPVSELRLETGIEPSHLEKFMMMFSRCHSTYS